MKFELEEYNRGVTDEELLADLRKVALELNTRAVTRPAYAERGRFGTTTFIRRFGSWFNVLEKAGLEKTRTPINLPIEELFRNLEELWTKLGRQPRHAEVLKPLSKYSLRVYLNRFGTWRRALEEFVTFINQDEAAQIKSPKQESPTEDLELHRTLRTVNWRTRFIVMRRDNFRCKVCGRSPATEPAVVLHVDHIKPWAKGGETLFENLQTLCSVCNIGKSDLD